MDAVPVWIVLVILGALGALCMLLIGIVRAHIGSDVKVHEKVAVHDEKIKHIDNEIYRSDGIMERLHEHGGEIHTLMAKEEMRERKEGREK